MYLFIILGVLYKLIIDKDLRIGYIFQVYKHRVRDGCRGTINPGPKKYKILNGHYLCLQADCASEYPDGAEILNTYSTREKFWKHIESVHSHPEDLLYTCDHCGKKFALKGMLKDHVVKVHDKPVSAFKSPYTVFALKISSYP